jgi:hypothetical protein
MPLILPGNVGSATAATGFDVANSCRFNPGDSAYMHKTPDAGDRQKATFSCWIKRSLIASAQTVFWAGSDNSNYQAVVRFLSNDKIVVAEINSGSTTWEIFTDRVFKDISAWYHIVVAMDTTQATAANRVKIYVNGVQETSLNIDGGYPAEDRNTLINTAVPHQIGHDYVAQYYGGYIAEACFLEGSQNAPTDFGEFDDNGIWKPIDVSGLTFGTNGFYLDFEASGNLGNDANGGTDLTEVNLAATDQSTDTCTNNFATFNPLASSRQSGGVVVYSEGNTKIVTEYSNTDYLRYPQAYTTLGVTSGKWYAEFKIGAIGSAGVGIANTGEFGSDGSTNPFAGRANSGAVYTNGGEYRAGAFTDVGSQGTYTENDIIGCALDMDNLAIYWHKNGTYINSGDPTSGSSKTGARAVFAQTTPGGFYVFTAGSDNTGVATIEINLGSPPYSESGGETDGNGYGNFNQAVPSGYFALCTKNLAEYG